MSATVKYNGSTIASVEDGKSVELDTQGKYMSGNVTVEAAGGGGGSGFLITVSGTTSEGRTLDKTGREIIDAVNAGFAPVFKYTDDDVTNICPFVSIQYSTSTGLVSIRARDWATSFTAVGFDNYPSIAPQGGGGND